MSRRPRTFFTTAAVIGILLAAYAAFASAEPEAVLHGRTNITAHVKGEVAGYRCQIAGNNLAGPWGTVSSDGHVTLALGPVHTNVNQLRVICEDPKRRDVDPKTVRSHWITYDGVLSPIRRIVNSTVFERPRHNG